jgi:hypothetical protein
LPLFSVVFRTLADRRGAGPIPILDVAWPSGSERYSDRPLGFSTGLPARPLLLDVPSITYGAGLRPGNLQTTDLSLTLSDKGRRITRILEGATDPRGSACNLYYALPGLAVADWHLVASGVFDRDEYEDGCRSIRLLLRPNDAPFKGNITKKQILKGECPLALETSFGVYLPLLYGEHDSSALTGKGMVPCININYDDTGWNYAVCLGWAKSVNRVYKNGTLQTVSTDYTVAYPIIGGAQLTAILFTSAPGETAVITADVEGYETVGNGSGELILNPVDQILHALTNFGFNDYRFGPWLDPGTTPLDLASFAISSSYASRSKFEGGNRLGGTADATTIMDALGGWLNSELPFRVFATNGGKLGMRPIDHVFGGYTSPGPAVPASEEALFVHGQTVEVGATFKPYRDTSLLIRRVDASFIYGAADQKFFQSLAVQNPSQQEEVSQSYQFAWSAPRLV